MQKNKKICSNTIGLFVNWDEKGWTKLKTLFSYIQTVRGKHFPLVQERLHFVFLH